MRRTALLFAPALLVPALAFAQDDAGAPAPGDATADGADAATATTTADAAPTIDPHELPPESPKLVVKQPTESLYSAMGGFRGGFALAAGEMGADVGPAGDFGLEGGARFLRNFYGGLIGSGTLFVTPSKTMAQSVSSFLFGFEAGWFSNPKGFGFFGAAGAALRYVSIGDSNGTSIGRGGGDFLLTVAMHFKIGHHVRLLPRIDMQAGAAGGYGHAIFVFGLSAWYNQDFGGSKKETE